MTHAFGHLISDYSSERLSQRIFERHAAEIAIKRSPKATKNLERIIEAFLKLSSKQGFHATSLRDLTKASGLSMGGLYSYIGSKDALLNLVLEQVNAAIDEVLAAAPADIRDEPLEHLQWIVEGHVHLTDVMESWFAFAFMEAKSFPRAARKATVDSELRTERQIRDVLARGVEAGKFRSVDIDLTAALIKPLLQDWYVKRAKYRKRGVSAADYARGVMNMIEPALAT